VHTQCTPSVHPVHTQCTPSAHPVHTQCTHKAHPLRTQCTPSAHTMHTQCTHNAHPVHTQCTPSSHPVHTQCTQAHESRAPLLTAMLVPMNASLLSHCCFHPLGAGAAGATASSLLPALQPCTSKRAVVTSALCALCPAGTASTAGPAGPTAAVPKAYGQHALLRQLHGEAASAAADIPAGVCVCMCACACAVCVHASMRVCLLGRSVALS